MVNNVGDGCYVTRKSGDLQKKVIVFIAVSCYATRNQYE